MAHLKTTESNVAIKLDYAGKLRTKHSLLPEHFYLIQPIINFGWVGVDPNRVRNLTFLYEDREIFQKQFKLVLKSNATGNETWLKTYFKIDPADYVAARRKCLMVRAAYEEGQP